MQSKANRKKGFSLLEALLASLLLGFSVIALSGISVKSMHQVQNNRDTMLAWQFLDKQMSMIELIGIDTFVETNILNGTSEETEIPYTWEVDLEQELLGNLYIVNMTVSWMHGSTPRSISASTMFNGSMALLSLE